MVATYSAGHICVLMVGKPMSEREDSKAREASIVKAAYEAAADAAENIDDDKVSPYSRAIVSYAIRALTPESTLLGAQLRELEARRDQAQAGVKVIQGLRMVSPSPIGPLHGAGWNDSIGHAERHLQAHVTDLESQIAQVQAELNKSS